MATIRDRNLQSPDTDDHIKKQEDEVKKSSNAPDQGEKTTTKADDLKQTAQAHRLSSEQSTNEDMKSTEVSSTLNNVSDTNTEKKNEDKTVETNKPVEESESTPVSSSSTIAQTTSDDANSNDNDNKKTESTTKVNVSDSNDNKNQQYDNTFTIGKGDSKYLTDFQRQKAKYFFNVNLDIENKEFVKWEDVEFYLLFHVTAAGKEGSDGGDLEARLSRATRAFWEHVHDQVPLEDGNRDQLTLDQFLDTWASLADYVVRRNQLPRIVEDLVKLGFELYSTDDNDAKSPEIQPNAFDQLFQKMNLGRTHAILAYKLLTQNDTQSLDADKIESLVKGVITSSDEDHHSHFLLPGFFKTLANNRNSEKEKTDQPSSPVPDNDESEVREKSSPTPTSPSQKPQECSSTSETKQRTTTSIQPDSTLQNGTVKVATDNPSTNKQQHVPVERLQKPAVQDQDENIRRLLRYYHIDDGDIVEVADGPAQRVVLLHPERPLPAYIQQNPKLLASINRDLKKVLTTPQNGSNKNNNSEKPLTENKPKVTLEERVSRGEAQKGPTIPIRQFQPQQGSSSSTRIRQVYPHISETQQDEQQKQAKLQAAQSDNEEKPKKVEATSTSNEATSLSSSAAPSKNETTKEKSDISRDEEEKLVASVLERLAPIVERKIAEELRRMQSSENEQEDDDNFMPFPFMFGGPSFFAPPGRGPPPQISRQEKQDVQKNATDTSQQQQQQQQQQPNDRRDAGFGGLPPGAGFIPPQLLMAMMSDLARGGMGGDIPVFPGNMPPPPRGSGGAPTGLEGFMMFVDDEQMMGGPAGFPPRSGPRF